MDSDVLVLGDRIANLTLFEAVQLSEYLESVHGIKPGFEAQVEEPPVVEEIEQTEFDIVLDGYLDIKKISLIKLWREMTGCGLKDAKEFVESRVGTVVKKGIPFPEAEALKARLEEAGAQITIQ